MQLCLEGGISATASSTHELSIVIFELALREEFWRSIPFRWFLAVRERIFDL